jgi:Carboxypeptidase regulatory-like domain
MNRTSNKSFAIAALAMATLFTPPAGCQTQQTSSGRRGEMWTVEGAVSDDARPVPGARIWCQGPCQAQEALADEQGHFAFKGATAGLIRIGAEKDGYSDAKVRTVSAQPGAHVEQVDLLIHKEGIVSGRVLDRDGDGIEGVEVILWARVFKDGGPSAAVRGASSTNDLGEYRIAGVGAGRYYLEALPKRLQPHKPMPAIANRDAKRVARFGIVRKMYYPNADSIDAASPIQVRDGQQAEGMDVRFRNATTFCVSAKVSASNPAISLRETPESGGAAVVGQVPVKAGEMFEICGLPSAQYRLTVLSTGEAEKGVINRVVAFSRTEFTIADRDVELGALSAPPASRLSGAATVAGMPSTAPFPPDVKVRLEPPDDRSLMVMSESFSAGVGPSGVFELQSVFSDFYRLRVYGLPRGYYIQQLTQTGRDVRFGGVRPEAGPVSILLGSDGAVIDGQVTDKDNLPVNDALVALMPKRTTVGAEILSQPADQDGRFTFSTEVAPGEYYVIAFSGLVEGEQQNLEFMRANIKDAQEIALAPGATRHVALLVQQEEKLQATAP